MDPHKKTCFGCGKELLVSKTKSEVFMQGNIILCRRCNKPDKWDVYKLKTKGMKQKYDLMMAEETRGIRKEVFGKPVYDLTERFGNVTVDDEVKRLEAELAKKKAEQAAAIATDRVEHGSTIAVNDIKTKLNPKAGSAKDEILNPVEYPDNAVIAGENVDVSRGVTGTGQADME
jgi:uncharacterized small protein (DUF1192 family)